MAARKSSTALSSIEIKNNEAFWNAWDDLVDEVIEYTDEGINDYVAEKMYAALYTLASELDPPAGHWRLNNPDTRTFKDMSQDKY